MKPSGLLQRLLDVNMHLFGGAVLSVDIFLLLMEGKARKCSRNTSVEDLLEILLLSVAGKRCMLITNWGLNGKDKACPAAFSESK